jgi:hypothetical protein
MITLEQYFRGKPHTTEHSVNAVDLMHRVTGLLEYASGFGAYKFDVDCDTGCYISGSKCGAGDGGFRLPDSTTGSQKSSHKEARGIDIYDPYNSLDEWLTDEILATHGLYREHPDKTPGWCHLTTREPGSKRRTFIP